MLPSVIVRDCPVVEKTSSVTIGLAMSKSVSVIVVSVAPMMFLAETVSVIEDAVVMKSRVAP